ncbi:MAG: hypothetical protein OEY97_12000 [Nitrospirota bacterium]|nr:hypothetical protein [Nitrospirota bacterium]
MKPRPRKPVTTRENRCPRVPLPLEGFGSIRVEATEHHSGRTVIGQFVNLNAEGTFIVCDADAAPFHPETYLTLDALARDDNTEYRFVVHGWVVYTLEEGMAIQFDEPPPETEYQIRFIVNHFLPESHHLSEPPLV